MAKRSLLQGPIPSTPQGTGPTGVRSLRQVEAEYARQNRAGNYVHSDEACKERVQEIKDQVTGYEGHTRLKEKAKNLMMDSMTKDLWHQRVNKDDPAELWIELHNDYHKAGVPELSKELAKYVDMNRTTYSNPQSLLNALKTQHSKIEVTLKAEVYHPKYLSWRYVHELNKYKPLFDIPLAKYDTLEAYPPPEEVKRALEAHLVNHSDIPKKPTVGKPAQPQPAASVNANVTKPSKKQKRDDGKPTSYSMSERPKCSHCNRHHRGDCWVKHPEKIPQAARETIAKRRKEPDEMLKGNTDQ